MTDYDARRGYNRRYKDRHDRGCVGWADAESYEKKRAEIAELIARYAIPAKGRFLELGCGNGNTTLYAANLGFDAHGVDVIPEAVSWAEENRRAQGIAADFRLGSVVDLADYPDASFDFVFDGDCLHCIIGEDRATCLGNVLRVLKPGAVFRAKSNCFDESVTKRYDIAPGCYFEPKTQCLVRNDAPYYYLSRDGEMERELKDAGFMVLKTEKIDAFEGKEPYQSCWLYVDARRPTV